MWQRQEQPAAVPGQRPERGLERLVIRPLVIRLLVIRLLVIRLLVLWLLVEIELVLEPAQGW